MLEFTVGRPFPLPQVKEEGSTFTVEPFSFMLVYRYNRPTAEEVSEFRTGDVSFSITELRQVIFVQSKFGHLHWSDTPYSMQLTPSQKNLPELSDSNLGYALDAFLVDCADNTLLVHRLVRLDLDFSRKLRMLLLDDLKKGFDPKTYNESVAEVFRTFSSRDMLERGLFSTRIRKEEAPQSATARIQTEVPSQEPQTPSGGETS